MEDTLNFVKELLASIPGGKGVEVKVKRLKLINIRAGFWNRKIIVTQGFLKALKENYLEIDEAKAILAHEIGHLESPTFNRNLAKLMAIASMIGLALILIFKYLVSPLIQGALTYILFLIAQLSNNLFEALTLWFFIAVIPTAMATTLIIVAVTLIILRLITKKIYWPEELYADQYAAKTVGTESLIKALSKIAKQHGKPLTLSEKMLKAIAKLVKPHPPLHHRIEKAKTLNG